MQSEQKDPVIDIDEEEPCATKAVVPFGVVLHHANRVFTRMLDAELRPLGVTSAQLGPLIVMAKNNGPMLQRDLVRQSAIAQPAMATALNLLSRNGFITQRRHEQDRRAIVLELTENGRLVVEQATPVLTRCNARAVSGLSPDEEKAMLRLIAKVISNIEHPPQD